MGTLRDQYADNTRRVLLETGLRLFTERDYADISAEELVRTAGLTRGALYHHFDGKPGLFESVLEDLERQVAESIRAAVSPLSDPRERAHRAVDAFLDACCDSAYQQIVLRQGPIALGWHRWRELDQLHLGTLLLDLVDDMLDTGLPRQHPAPLVVSAFYGALTELSITIADSNTPQRTRAQAAALVRDLIDGLTRDADTPSP